VLVPPMSNPIMPFNYGFYLSIKDEVFPYPMTPPAGPDNIDRLPLKFSISESPPSDYMKKTFILDISESNPLINFYIYLFIYGFK
jgi:hypothetical protein